MKNRQFLISLLILLALLGFVASSIFMFYKAFEILDGSGQLPANHTDALNPALAYVTNGLTGLVGGIVAAAFGVSLSGAPGTKSRSIHNRSIQNLGSMVYSGTKASDDRHRALYGFLYALSYIAIGVAAVVIWIVLGNNTIQGVSNTATTFLGMMVPIVATYFKQ